MEILEKERIDDLGYKGLKIIQNEEGFCFGIDSILLSDFAKDIKKGSKVIDLGTGTGILGIMLCAKTQLLQMVGVEIQKQVADMAKRSIKLNNLQDRFEIINEDIKKIEERIEMGIFDVVVTNPPYKKLGTGIINQNEKKLISRHEITANLEDFIKISQKLLKDKGTLYMVHRPNRLVDIIELLRKYQIEPKIIKFVYPSMGKESNMVLIKAVKNANPFLKIEPSLYVYEENGEYTQEIKKIYNQK